MKLQLNHGGILQVIIGFFMLFLGALPKSNAGGIYAEWGGNFPMYFSSQNLYPALTGTSSIGYGGHLGFGINFRNLDRAFQWHLGVDLRMNWASGDSAVYGYHVVYPFLRLEFARKIYFTFGLSPFVYTTEGESISFATTPVTGGISSMVEVGYQQMITAIVSMNFSLVGHVLYKGGEFGPMPVLEGSIGLRWYFGPIWKSTGGEKNKYDGWRYKEYF